MQPSSVVTRGPRPFARLSMPHIIIWGYNYIVNLFIVHKIRLFGAEIFIPNLPLHYSPSPEYICLLLIWLPIQSCPGRYIYAENENLAIPSLYADWFASIATFCSLLVNLSDRPFERQIHRTTRSERPPLHIKYDLFIPFQLLVRGRRTRGLQNQRKKCINSLKVRYVYLAC